MPCSATHGAVARVPDPHQIRSDSPGDSGWTGNACRRRRSAGVRVHDAGTRDRRPEQLRLASRELGVAHPLGRRVAEGVGAAIGGLGRAAADSELQPPAAEQSAAAASSAM